MDMDKIIWRILVITLVILLAIFVLVLTTQQPSQDTILNETVEGPFIEELRPGEGFVCDGKQVRVNNIVVSKEWFRDNYQMDPERLLRTIKPFNITEYFQFYGEKTAAFQIWLDDRGTEVILGVSERENATAIKTLSLGESCEIGNWTISFSNIQLEVVEGENDMIYPVCPKVILELS